MIRVLLSLLELPYGCFFSSGKPLMLTTLLPAIQHRFVLPLVWASSKNKRRLLPDAATGEIEPSLFECTTEIKSFCICVENIYGSKRKTNP